MLFLKHEEFGVTSFLPFNQFSENYFDEQSPSTSNTITINLSSSHYPRQTRFSRPQNWKRCLFLNADFQL